MTTHRLIVSGVFLYLALSIALCVFVRNEALRFYVAELDSADSIAHVAIGSRPYIVEQGRIDGRTRYPGEVFRVLQLSYAQELARRAPILGINGTDPAKLAHTVDILRSGQEALASVQPDKRDAALVHDSLYPLDFLHALAELEAERARVLEQGTESNVDAYRRALHATVEAGITDLEQINRATRAIAQDSNNISLTFFSGSMTPQRLIESLTLMSRRFKELDSALGARDKCLRGITNSCERGVLTIQSPDLVRMPPEEPGHRTNIASTRDVLRAVYGDEYLDSRVEIVTAQSACMGMFAPPYHFLVTPSDTRINFDPIDVLNDMYFSVSREIDGSVTNYLRAEYGIDYILVKPMAFYQCPSIARDVGTLYAILNAKDFALKNPSIAAPERAQLLEDPNSLREDAAIAYIRAIIAELPHQRSYALREEIIGLVQMFTQRSAELDYLVGEIGRTSLADVGVQQSGAPFNNDAHTLFLTHSMTASLMLAHNPYAGSTFVGVTNKDPKTRADLRDQYVAYSSLRFSTSVSEIVRNIRALDAFEGLGQPAAQ